MKKIIWLVILAYTLIVIPCIAQEEIKHTSSFNQQWLKCIVSIEVYDEQGKGVPIGTGFLVGTPNKHIALVTAKHVIYEDEGKGRIRQNLAYRLNRTDAKSILVPDAVATEKLKSGWFKSDAYDVACRLVVREDVTEYVTLPYSLFLATSKMEAGAPLFIIGFPLGLRSEQYATPIVRRASLARVDEGVLIVDGFVYPGNSGGPVIYEPTIRLGQVFTTPILQGDWFVGMVLSEISYIEPAISLQTKRPRVTFEQNSGLSKVLPSDKILDLLSIPEFVKVDESIK